MENPRIDWIQKSQLKCLRFTFQGKLTETEAQRAIERWRKLFAIKPDDKIILIWDCLNMDGYDSGARIQWQQALKDLKNQIDSIWLLTTSNIIKMGAAVMSLFTSFPIKVVGSETEIPFE